MTGKSICLTQKLEDLFRSPFKINKILGKEIYFIREFTFVNDWKIYLLDIKA